MPEQKLTVHGNRYTATALDGRCFYFLSSNKRTAAADKDLDHLLSPRTTHWSATQMTCCYGRGTGGGSAQDTLVRSVNAGSGETNSWKTQEHAISAKAGRSRPGTCIRASLAGKLMPLHPASSAMRKRATAGRLCWNSESTCTTSGCSAPSHSFIGDRRLPGSRKTQGCARPRC